MTNSANTLIEDDAKIDLTPMLDVVFIMLIFFIITATFINEATIALQRPAASASPPSSELQNIIVELQADNQILLDNRAVDHRALRAYFERHRAEYPEASLIIKADKLSKTHKVVQISNAGREAGIYQITLANGE